MAFRNHNPNLRSPFVSDEGNWSSATPADKTNKLRPFNSKENAADSTTAAAAAAAAASPSSTAFAALPEDAKHPTYNGAGEWSGVNGSIGQRDVRPNTKDVAELDRLLSGRRAPKAGDSKRTTETAFGIWSDDDVKNNNTSAMTVPRANKAKNKTASWKATSNLNGVFSRNNENEEARGNKTKDKNKSKDAVFNLETLSSTLPSNAHARAVAPFQPRPRSAFTSHAASAFTKVGSNDKMDYSAAAARNNAFTTDKPSKKLLGFPIYTDHPVSTNELSQLPQLPKPTQSKLQDYTRKLLRLSEQGEFGAAEKAEALLRDMLERYKEGKDTLRPDGSCYNQYVSSLSLLSPADLILATQPSLTFLSFRIPSVIHAYAKAGRPEKAQIVLRLMFEDYNEGGNLSAEPNVRVFTNLLHAWRKSKDPTAPESCEQLLQHMDELSDNHGLSHCKPDVFAVTVLLHCWVESGRKEAGARANEIFRNMKERFLNGEEGLRPDCICYSIVLNTFAQESKTKEAEALLWEMVDDFLSGNDSAAPRTRNFNTIMAMYARSDQPDAPERAEGVLFRFRELCDKGVIENRPDAYTYSLLLKTWVTSGRRDGIDQALAALNWMGDLYEGCGDQAACPDIIKYTTIIAAMVRRGDRANADALLNAMVQDYIGGNFRARPDYKLFDTVIGAYTVPAGNAPIDASRAEALLRRMWTLHDSGKFEVRPRASTYKQVIVAYKKTNNAKHAEALLWEMDDRKIPVDKKVFQTVLNAWHESHAHDKQHHIQKIRNVMGRRFGRR